MEAAETLESMLEDEVLDYAESCAETARRADVDLLRARTRELSAAEAGYVDAVARLLAE